MLPPWPTRPPAHGPIRLRAFRDDDVGFAVALSQDSYVPQTGSLPWRASVAEAAAWVERQRGRHAEGVGCSFAIARIDTDQAIGQIGLWCAHLDRGLATAGYAIAPPHRGHGYASAALIALVEFGFSLPGLDRIQLHVEPWNTPSRRAARGAGFRNEGLRRRHQVIGGEPRDVVVLAISRPGGAGGRGDA